MKSGFCRSRWDPPLYAKYGRGRVPALRQAFWVFVCISRLAKERWFEPIPNNSWIVYEFIFQRWVAANSFIMSDYRRSYGNVHLRLGMKGHGKVNHKRRFFEGTMDIPGMSPMLGIDVPNNPRVSRVKVHTNTIKRPWRDMMSYFRTFSSVISHHWGKHPSTWESIYQGALFWNAAPLLAGKWPDYWRIYLNFSRVFHYSPGTNF